MKRLFTFCLLIIQFCFCLSAITLTDMTTLCNMKKWNETDIFLKKKGWHYYSSSDTSMMYVKTGDQREMLSVFFDHSNNVNRITSLASSNETYLKICEQLKKSGYTVYSDNIDATQQTVLYQNKGYNFEITQFNNQSSTVFRFSIVKPFSGTKVVQIKETNVREYNYIDGKRNGKQKFYFREKLLIECNYIDDKASGDCAIYLHSDNNWYVKFEGKISNNLMVGKWTTYVNDYGNDRVIGYFNMGDGRKMRPDPCAVWNESTYMVTSISDNKTLVKYYILDSDEGNEYVYTYQSWGQDVRSPNWIENYYKSCGFVLDEPITFLVIRFIALVTPIPRLATSDVSKLTLQSETTLVGNVENGTKKVYENGMLSETINIVNGQENGPFTMYYTNEVSLKGKVHLTCNFKNGKKEGTETLFDTRGNIICKRTYKDGKVVGDEIWYYTSDPYYIGQLFYRKNVKPKQVYNLVSHNDKKEVKSVVYDMYGEATIIGSYANDVMHGPEKVYYNGPVKVYYTRDKEFTVYMLDNLSDNPKRNLYYTCEYVNGMEEGECVYFDRNSQVITKCNYHNGKLNGTLYKYFTSDNLYSVKEMIDPSQTGFLYSKENYKDGLLHGESTKYHMRNPVQTDVYDNGKKIKCTLYKNGKVIETIDNSKKTHIQIKGDTIIEITRTCKLDDELFSVPKAIDEPILTIDNLYSFNNKDLLYRQFEVKIGGVKVTSSDGIVGGEFIFNDRTQNLVIRVPKENIKKSKRDFSNVTFHKTFNDELFTGTYNIIDKTSSVKSELKIKKGFVETAKISDLRTGETIEKQKYKKGILEE